MIRKTVRIGNKEWARLLLLISAAVAMLVSVLPPAAAATGQIVWIEEIAPVWGGTAEVLFSPDGATVYTAVAYPDMKVLATSALTGQVVWSSTYANEFGRHTASDLVLSLDGSSLFVVGEAPVNGNNHLHGSVAI